MGPKSGGSTIKSRYVSEGYIEKGAFESQMGRGKVEMRISFPKSTSRLGVQQRIWELDGCTDSGMPAGGSWSHWLLVKLAA
jgi:hypothetical protein